MEEGEIGGGNVKEMRELGAGRVQMALRVIRRILKLMQNFTCSHLFCSSSSVEDHRAKRLSTPRRRLGTP